MKHSKNSKKSSRFQRIKSKLPSMPSMPKMPTFENLRTYSTLEKVLAVLLILIIIASIVLIIYYNVSDTFANTVDSSVKNMNMNGKVIMFMSKTCPNSTKQLEVFDKEGTMGMFILKDIENDDVKEEAKNYKVMGLPYFVSPGNQTATLGFHENTKSILDELAPKNKMIQKESFANENAEIVLIAREGCGYCTKAKEDIASKNANVKILEFSSPEAKEIIDKFSVKSGGVPIFVNVSNGKYVVGFKPIEKIKEELA